ncbi:hypothetical protein SSCG_03679 [Streptomyces clavuligerus]|nr:hypothetical protein SSCG_03679 [Streptomyces clavuligerus]
MSTDRRTTRFSPGCGGPRPGAVRGSDLLGARWCAGWGWWDSMCGTL